MDNQQFSVIYNGHPVAVTALGDDRYLVQVTYKPVQIQLQKNLDGTENWIEVETQRESYLTHEVGNLISGHLYSNAHV